MPAMCFLVLICRDLSSTKDKIVCSYWKEARADDGAAPKDTISYFTILLTLDNRQYDRKKATDRSFYQLGLSLLHSWWQLSILPHQSHFCPTSLKLFKRTSVFTNDCCSLETALKILPSSKNEHGNNN